MIHLEQKMCGFYKIEAVKKSKSGKETKRLLADWFPNLITTAGLNDMGTRSSYFYNSGTYHFGWIAYCIVGTGNTTPSFNDSVLVNKIASTNTVTALTHTVEANSPYYRKLSLTYRFGEGVAAGNIAEVGIGWSTTECFSRALILDGGGNPTTITILSDEYLDVSYEYRIYPKETDDTGTVIFTGNIGGTYDWVARLARATTWGLQTSGYYPLSMQMGGYNVRSYPSSDPIQAITGYPSDGGSLTIGNMETYVAGNFYTIRSYTLSLTQGNITGGVNSFHIAVGSCYYQIGFTPAIPKTASDILTIKFKVSWGRV